MTCTMTKNETKLTDERNAQVLWIRLENLYKYKGLVNIMPLAMLMFYYQWLSVG